MTTLTKRDEEIRDIWKEYKDFYQVLGGLVLVFIGVVIGAILFSVPADRAGYLINLYTSILSIVVTVFVIDLLNRRRDERNAVKQLQAQLVRDASSIVNDVANNAVHQMRKRNWLEGDKGLLAGADLAGARLQGANLAGVNLQEVVLVMTNLQEADLMAVRLQGAVLVRANLQKARLWAANLQGANLARANLQEADLMGARLQGAVLVRANLQGANLQGAELKNAHFDDETLFDANTILPDGKCWTPDTDMKKFTQ